MAARSSDVRLARRERLVYPKDAEPEDAPGPVTPPAPLATIGPPRIIDLVECLRIATLTNRDFITRREQLFLSALSLLGTRQTFHPQLAASLGYVLSGGEDLESSRGASFSAALNQALPTGGNLSLGASANASRTFGEDSYASALTLSIDQPLMRGAGRVVAWEALTQAERNLYYAVRAFELFRQDFAVDVAARYYNLVQQRRSIENTRRNFDSFTFSRKQAEALFQVGRRSELDVLRAKRSELNARNALIAAEENFLFALDQFRIFLGLPLGTPIEIRSQEPDYVPLSFDLASAVDVAFTNRLDYRTRLEQLEDAERAVRISADGLRPDLDLRLGYAFDAEPSSSFGDKAPDLDSYDASLVYRLPLNRVQERNSYRATQIALDREKRNLELFEQTIEIEIRRAFRELKRRTQSLEIQTQIIQDQQRNVSIAQLRFERGEIPNRDVVEAQQSLLEARNSLIGEQVNYEVARLQLLRDLGILFIDDTGVWIE